MLMPPSEPGLPALPRGLIQALHAPHHRQPQRPQHHPQHDDERPLEHLGPRLGVQPPRGTTRLRGRLLPPAVPPPSHRTVALRLAGGRCLYRRCSGVCLFLRPLLATLLRRASSPRTLSNRESPGGWWVIRRAVDGIPFQYSSRRRGCGAARPLPVSYAVWFTETKHNMRIVTLRFGTGNRKCSLNDVQSPNFRVVRVYVSTGYTHVEINRRASRNGRVRSPPPENPTVTIR